MNIEKLLEDLTLAMESPVSAKDIDLEVMLRDSLAEEEAAVSAYLQRAKQCIDLGDERLAKLFNELAADEKIHAASLKQALDEFGYEDVQLEIEGAEEFVDITEEE